MICCKIITDFKTTDGSFKKLMENLSKYGEILFNNSYLYFADSENDKTNEKTVVNILNRCGYKKHFIDVYTKENPPKEGDMVDGWIIDKICRINYLQYEKNSQEAFHIISNELDKLNEKISCSNNATEGKEVKRWWKKKK